MRQVKYLNNFVEPDHRAIKRVTKRMLNFKTFHFADSVIAGIELMYMILKCQFAMDRTVVVPFVDQFNALAGQSVQFKGRSAMPE